MDDFFPPVGQGCIAVEASIQLDPEKRERLRACINHRESETCLLAERAFLRQLEGGCAIPAFALARIAGGMLTLSAGLMASMAGTSSLPPRRVPATRRPRQAIGWGRVF